MHKDKSYMVNVMLKYFSDRLYKNIFDGCRKGFDQQGQEKVAVGFSSSAKTSKLQQ